MGYCPRCGEEGDEVMLDCGDQVCTDCASERERREGICRKCVAEEEATKAARAAKAKDASDARPDSCADCEYALYDGDEVEACMHDPEPPDDEPSPGKPCRYWEKADA